MKAQLINHYTEIKKIENRYREVFIQIKKVELNKHLLEMTIIEIFLDLYSLNNKYDEIFTPNSFSIFIKNEYTSLIGFIYFQLECTNSLKYTYSKKIERLFLIIMDGKLKTIRVNYKNISNEILESEKYFRRLKPNPIKLKFYDGWELKTQDNNINYINLRDIYNYYGKEFCDRYHTAIKNIAFRKIQTSFSRDITNIYKLNYFFIKKFKTLNDLEANLNAYSSVDTFSIFYNTLVLECILKKECLVSFHKRWRTIVNTYIEITNENFFEKPHFSIFIPQFKTSNFTHNKKTVGGEIINKKLITDVPLHHTDSIAKEIIYSNIESDLSTCIHIANYRINKIMDNYEYFILENKYKDIQKIYLENPFKYPNQIIHPAYLKTKSMNADFRMKLFGSISLTDIYALVIILITEHPQITESWLTNWRYIKDGKNYGYEIIDNNAYIISHKLRKGDSSLQKILLNEKSNNIVKLIIKITNFARNFLINTNNKDHEFMLLSSATPFALPKRIKKFLNPSTDNTFRLFENLFFCADALKFLKTKQIERLDNLVRNFSLTRLRATAAVVVYFKTNSINQMSIALGHSKLDVKLLSSYLPKPLWDYFTDRWIRIFQNILIYESLKDTNYLLSAMDINESNLDDFIKNHHFKEIPIHIENGKYGSNVILNNQNVGVFSISTPLLQVFIAIVSFIENFSENKSIPDFIQRWYQCAILVISQIRLCIESDGTEVGTIYLDEKILDMYKIALNNPIDIKHLGWE